MGPFLLGFLLAGLVGVTLVYGCYNKREITERKLRQNIQNLEHNVKMITKESEIAIEQLEVELKKTKDENRKCSAKLEVVTNDFHSVREQLEACKRQLAE
jgi:septal ring factor EnvC (AmiA/AmiB activator)